MDHPEDAANAAICLINQTNALLDQKLRWLEERFVNEGGFRENLFLARRKALHEARTNSTQSRMVSYGGKKRMERRLVAYRTTKPFIGLVLSCAPFLPEA